MYTQYLNSLVNLAEERNVTIKEKNVKGKIENLCMNGKKRVNKREETPRNKSQRGVFFTKQS